MICPRCNQQAARVIIRKEGAYCSECSTIAATGGARVDGILTRNASRIRSQHEHHRADMAIPHVYDKSTGKMVPNPEFVKLYPENTSLYYTEDDVKKSGDKKLAKLWKKQEAERATHHANLDKLDNKPGNPKKNKEKIAKTIEAL